MRPTGWSLASASWVASGFIGVLMMPGATALTRTPRLANSMARERVTAFSAPLVSAASAAGTPAIGWSTRAAVIETMWPDPLLQHLGGGALRDVEETGDIDRQVVVVVG